MNLLRQAVGFFQHQLLQLPGILGQPSAELVFPKLGNGLVHRIFPQKLADQQIPVHQQGAEKVRGKAAAAASMGIEILRQGILKPNDISLLEHPLPNLCVRGLIVRLDLGMLLKFDEPTGFLIRGIPGNLDDRANRFLQLVHRAGLQNMVTDVEQEVGLDKLREFPHQLLQLRCLALPCPEDGQKLACLDAVYGLKILPLPFGKFP